MNKPILDPCCGSRMFWFDKENPNVVFGDIRKGINEKGRNERTCIIEPDIQMDFRNMPFPDESFKLVVFDPPHLKTLGKTSWLAKKYGRLFPTWEDDIKHGFDECMRVLEPLGVLIFKWNEYEIATKRILQLIEKNTAFRTSRWLKRKNSVDVFYERNMMTNYPRKKMVTKWLETTKENLDEMNDAKIRMINNYGLNTVIRKHPSKPNYAALFWIGDNPGQIKKGDMVRKKNSGGYNVQ